jgi:uncharacterized LabA/DUF88 family protein
VAFFEALQKQGIETKIKDLQVFAGGAKKGDWDVGMAIDAIVMSPRLDTIVIISGDGDFVPLVQYLQMHSGVRVEVATFEASASASLVAAADHFLDLSEAPKKILMGRTARATSPKKNTKKVLKSETARKPKKGSGRKNSKADK